MKFHSFIKHLIILISCFCLQNNIYGQELELTISTGHLGKVKSMAITNDAQLLATAGEDAAVKIWNINDQRLLYSYYPHEIGINILCFSQDKKYLATAGMDGRIEIMNITTHERVFQLDNIEGEVLKMKFIGGFLLFITKGGIIYRIDWENKKLAPDGQTIKTDLGNFSALNYSYKMDWLTVGMMEGDLFVWRGYERPVVDKKGLHSDWISAVDYIPADSLIITSSWDKTIKIWDINNDSIVQEINSPDNTPIVDLKYSSYFEVLVFATKARNIYFYQSHNGKIEGDPVAVRDDFDKMIFTEDTKYAAFSKIDGSIAVWKLGIGKSENKVEWKPVKGHLVDGDINKATGAIAFITTNGMYHSWKPDEIVITKTWQAHQGKANALEYILDGNRWVTTGSDSLVKLWEDDGKLIDSLKLSHKGTSLAYIPVLDHVIIGTNGGDIILWNKSERTARVLYQHNGGVINVVCDGDGAKVASIGRDRKLMVYDFAKNEIVYDSTVPDLWLNDVCFSEDGTQVLVSGKKGVYAWDCIQWKKFQTIMPEEDILKIDFLTKKQQWIFGNRSGAISIWNKSLTEELEVFEESTIPMVDIIPYIDQDVFFAVRTNTTFEIWNILKKKKGGEIIVMDDGKWVIEHYSGLFDVGDLNMDQLYYVYGTETIDFDQLKDKYWEPGLAYEILQGKPLRKVPSLKDLSLFPKTNSFEKEGKLYVEILERGGGIGVASLYINDKEVISDITKSAEIKVIDQKQYYVLDLAPLQIHLVPNQENDIAILTSNEAGTLNGRGVKLKIKGKEVDLQAPPTLYGVVVGVSDYRGRLLDLKYASEDAKAMYTALELGSSKLFGIQNTSLQLLTTDAEEETLLPNKENIKRAFENVGKRATSSDVLFVFLAGHGTVAENTDGMNDFHFLTKDMSNSDVSDADIKNNYTISGTELLDWIKDIPISKQVFVVDACHAGSFSTELITSRDYNEEGMKKRALERMRAKTGMFMLSGASSDKVSYESSYLEHGLLTYSLLDFLKRGDLDEGRFVDVQDLFLHAVEAVPELASSMNGEQQPEYRVPVGAGSFYIGEYSPNDRNEIELSVQKNLISAIYLEDGETWADHLKLSEKVKNHFVLESEEEDLLVRYQKGAKGLNTYIVRGKYTVHKTNIVIKLHLISNDKLLEKWTVKARDVKDCQEQITSILKEYFLEK